jgi:hypothetical protein
MDVWVVWMNEGMGIFVPCYLRTDDIPFDLKSILRSLCV